MKSQRSWLMRVGSGDQGRGPRPMATLRQAVAEESGLSQKAARATLRALFTVLVRSLRRTGKGLIPNVAVLVAKKRPATLMQTKKLFGKVAVVAARPERVVLRVRTTKRLRDALV